MCLPKSSLTFDRPALNSFLGHIRKYRRFNYIKLTSSKWRRFLLSRKISLEFIESLLHFCKLVSPDSWHAVSDSKENIIYRLVRVSEELQSVDYKLLFRKLTLGFPSGLVTTDQVNSPMCLAGKIGNMVALEVFASMKFEIGSFLRPLETARILFSNSQAFTDNVCHEKLTSFLLSPAFTQKRIVEKFDNDVAGYKCVLVAPIFCLIKRNFISSLSI
jgi:hypothetical protein